MTKTRCLVLIASLCLAGIIVGQVRSQPPPVSLSIRAAEESATRGSAIVVGRVGQRSTAKAVSCAAAFGVRAAGLESNPFLPHPRQPSVSAPYKTLLCLRFPPIAAP